MPTTCQLCAARACACVLPLAVVFAWLATTPAAHADPAGSTAGSEGVSTISPPRLLEQVELSYPEEAKATGEHGDVSVLVDLDSAGRVVGVRFERGPVVFRDSAMQAAQKLRFAPATRDGQPVATTTRVSFHFAPPIDGELPDEGAPAEVVVHASDPDVEDTRARTTLDEEDLERAAGDDFAETVEEVPGVRKAGGTTDASKPIIRGQSERRLLVLFDGVRHESQKWGPDHATEIDPFSAGTISVIRGAAGARYGPDAIGGVLLVEPPPMRSEPGVGGKLLTAYASNGRRPYGAARVDFAPERVNGLSFRVEGNASAGAALSAPTYILGNTASRVWNLGGAVGYRWGGGQLRASWHHHDFAAGIFYGVRISTPTEFESQLALERPVTADLWKKTYSIDRPRQEVSHDVAVLDLDLAGEWGSLEATYAFQINRRQEYEQVRDNITAAQFDFTLRTHSLDVLYKHPTKELPVGVLNGGVGLQGSFQENVYRGLALLPNYRSFGGGVFAYERLSLKRFDLEAGARVDGLSRAAYMRENDYEAHVRRETLDPSACTEGGTTFRCPTAYETASASVGMLAHVVPDRLDVKLDLSTASRFPNVDELYLLGSAPSLPVFGNGSPSLGAETAWGASLTTGLRTPAVQAEVSAYAQWVDDFIYFSPELTPDGRPRYDVTIRGTWPSFGYAPIDAVFYGADGSVSLAPNAPLGLDVQGALVRAVDAESGAHLIGTPADHLRASAIARPPDVGLLRDIELRAIGDAVAKQSRVDPDADFAPPPDGYVLFGASLDASIGEERVVRVGVQANNLFNTSYRDYTSLLRYYADQPGRDVRVRVGSTF